MQPEFDKKSDAGFRSHPHCFLQPTDNFQIQGTMSLDGKDFILLPAFVID
jgi:hypothetical protein